MPLIKAGSQLGDIYQNPNNKLPKGIGNEIISKKQQIVGGVQGGQNGVVKYLQNQTASPSQTFFKGKWLI